MHICNELNLLVVEQTFMQAIKKSDRIQQKMKTIMEPKIRSMLFDYGLRRDMESDIKSRIEYKLEQDEDVNACGEYISYSYFGS